MISATAVLRKLSKGKKYEGNHKLRERFIRKLLILNKVVLDLKTADGEPVREFESHTGSACALRVRDSKGLRLQAQPSPNRPFAGRAAGSVARRGSALHS
jgi:hypothetical protein